MGDRKGLWKKLSLPAVWGLLLLVALGGVLLATWEAPAVQTVAQEEDLDVENFRADAVKKLEELLQSVEGVGKVQVMVTVETTPIKVYAEDTQSSYEKTQTEATGNNQSQTVFSQEDGKEKSPILLYHRMPRIGGVAVVCQGAKDPQVCLKITQLVSGLFGIGANRVCVTN